MDIATAEVMPVDQYPKAYDCWSPAPGQGGYLYFVANKDWETEIYYMDSKGNVEQLTSSPGPVSNWSPAPAASGTVYFVSNRDQYIGIYYVDRQKGRIRLTPDNQESWGPVPGLFGTLFFTSNESGKAEIYKRNWLGQITRVTFTPDPYETWTGPKNEKSLRNAEKISYLKVVPSMEWLDSSTVSRNHQKQCAWYLYSHQRPCARFDRRFR